MKTIRILNGILAILTLSAGCGKPGGPTWTARYVGLGSEQEDEPRCIKVDPSGNTYVTGYSGSSWPNTDLATVKYDSQGNQEWASRYDGSAHGNDWAKSMTLDEDGNVYVTGSVTIKYDPEGSLLWVAQNGEAGGEAIEINKSGHVFVAGDFTTVRYDADGRLLWTAPVGGGTLAVDDQSNAYVAEHRVTYRLGRETDIGETRIVKLNADGREDWRVSYQEEGDKFRNHIIHMALDDARNVFAAWAGGNGDVVTTKHDSQGNELWRSRFSFDAERYGVLEGIDVDKAGGVLVTATEGAGWLPNRYVTIKYNPQGSRLWASFHSGEDASWNKATAQALDAFGNVYVTGMVGTLPYTEFATIKYSPNGCLLWEERYNGPEDSEGLDMDAGTALTVDNLNNVYVTGVSYAKYTGFDYLTMKYVQNVP